jgi:hypothetical protein|uniref:CHAP domain protein n=1 Tax=Siphoviridae sp. ctP6113 TaxID=2826318 RepID=A0A8S5MTJ0_9CAUD|nr:MAG TPA: CHAP domain protein [Siphoviridae sp. ctP6113]
MGTASDVLRIACAELGYKESPANSNQTKYGAWYGLNGQPWCMMFLQWIFHQAGVSDLLPVKTASCGALMRAAQSVGLWVTSNYQPGDLVIYDFPGGAATDHCGIVESVSSIYVTAIEGNTAVGDDSNGGEVMRRTRPLSQVVGAVRPKYEEEDDMSFENWSTEQFIRFTELQQAALSKRPIGDTLAPELQEAVSLGITDGSSPNALCTRAQAAIMSMRTKNISR